MAKPSVVLREALLLAARLAPGTGVPVLSYHKICDDGAAAHSHPLAVSRERFAAQMAYLAAAGYRTVPPSQVLAAGNGRRRIALTFDDGHADALEIAAPILGKFGFTAAVFPVIDWIGTSGWLDHRNGDRLAAPLDPADLPTRFLDWSELRELQQQGWEVGSHTCTHRPLLELGAGDRRWELLESRRLLTERLGASVELFAYPYRSYGTLTLGDVRSAGYRLAFSLEPGLNTPRVEPMSVRRAAVRGWNDLRDFQLRLTARYTQFRRVAGAVERRGGAPVVALAAAGQERR